MTVAALVALVAVVDFVLHIAAFVYLLRGLPGSVARQFLVAIGYYLLHGALGIATLIYLRPVLSNGPNAAFGAMAALFAWFGLGLHVLFRLIPSEGPKPQWALRFGIFDVACLLVLAGGSAVAAGFI
jgi:hypothetical protein